MAGSNYSYQDPTDEQPLGELFSELSGNLQQLLKKEVELAKVEATEQAKRAGKAGAMFGATAVMGFFGLMLLFFAAAWGLATVIPTGLAFLAVGLLCLVIAGIFLISAKKEVAGIRPPQQTVQTLKQDVQVAQTSLKRGLQSEPDTYGKGR
ncbi:MAG: phage holin family protein [Actinobacteria bacterium]|nr:phage holin family protein [Actinomycetota bacterium]